MIVSILNADEVSRQWGAIAEQLKPACEYDPEGRVTLFSLYDDLMTGKCLCVVFTGEDKEGPLEGACVVTATDVVMGKYLFIKVLGGRFHDKRWIETAHNHLSQLAAVLGCDDGIMFTGRPGWVRRLKTLGYREIMVTMIKKLEK